MVKTCVLSETGPGNRKGGCHCGNLPLSNTLAAYPSLEMVQSPSTRDMKEILLKRHDSIKKTGAEEEKSSDHPAPVPIHMFYKYSTIPTTVFPEDRSIKHTETLLNPSLAYIALHLPELAVVDAYRAGIAIDASMK